MDLSGSARGLADPRQNEIPEQEVYETAERWLAGSFLARPGSLGHVAGRFR